MRADWTLGQKSLQKLIRSVEIWGLIGLIEMMNVCCKLHSPLIGRAWLGGVWGCIDRGRANLDTARSLGALREVDATRPASLPRSQVVKTPVQDPGRGPELLRRGSIPCNDPRRQGSRRTTSLSLTFTASSESFSTRPKRIARYHRKM